MPGDCPSQRFDPSPGMGALGLGKFIGEDKNGSCQIRRQRLLPIIIVHESILPSQEVGIVAGKFIPARSGSGASHTLSDQKDVSPGYGLVVKLGLSMDGREPPQSVRKHLQCLKDGVV